MPSEQSPLRNKPPASYGAASAPAAEDEPEHVVPHQPTETLGLGSALAIVVGRIIGTGIFSTPGPIVAAVGSLGGALLCWLIGGLGAFCGLFVWLEWATLFPENGGEKVYLQHAYPWPRRMAARMFATRALLIPGTPSTAIILATNLEAAMGIHMSAWAHKLVALSALSSVILLHSLAPRWGIRFMDSVAALKVAILSGVVIAGVAVLTGHTRINDPSHNLQWSTLWAGTATAPSLWTSALFRTFNSYAGWNSAAYIAGEMRDARRTIVRASIGGLGLCTSLYILVNVAYASAIPAEDMKQTVAVAAEFAKALAGPAAQRGVSAAVAVSALGVLVNVSFASSRVLRELGADGTAPAILVSTWPHGAPAAALATHWAVSACYLLLLPAGPVAYGLILDVEGYTISAFFLAVTAGLYAIRRRLPYPTPEGEHVQSTDHFVAPTWAAIVFGLISMGLVVAPWAPAEHPTPVPSWVGPTIGTAILALGFASWSVLDVFPRWRASRRRVSHQAR